MRIAHVAIATPRRCGLYETTRELVAAERALGADARIVDPQPIAALYPGDEDRGVPLADMDWARTADVIASHSGHDKTPLAKTQQPIIHVAHGRPLSTFLGERAGGPPAYSYQVTRSKRPRYKACVTFWPEYEPILRAMWSPKPVRVVPPPVDLARWSAGPTPYDFGGQKANLNVVMADPWCRVDVSPFFCIHAFALFRAIRPDAKLHLFALDGNLRGLRAIQTMLGDSLGLIQGWAADLLPVYRAADLLITPHRIYTRSIREAMSCGCQVVSGRDCNPEDVENFALTMARRLDDPQPARRLAMAWFDPAETAREFLRIAEEACGD